MDNPCATRPVSGYGISKSPTNDSALALLISLYVACICSAKRASRAISVIGHVVQKLNSNLIPVPVTGQCSCDMWDGH